MRVAIDPDLKRLIDAYRRPLGLTRPQAVRRLISLGLRRRAHHRPFDVALV
jgi:hypothetical protein